MTFIGHSHMVCVLLAAQHAGIPFRAVALKEGVTPKPLGGLDRTNLLSDRAKPDFRDDTKTLLMNTRGPVFSFIGGIQHVQIALWPLRHPGDPVFDVVLPDATDLPLHAQAEVIPYGALRAAIERAYRKRLKLLERVTALVPGRVYQFGPPPPVRDRWITTFAKELDATGGAVPPALVRWKVWRTTIDVFRARAATCGAQFVDVPPASVDADGFLRDELVDNVTHGNEAFGALLLEQIRALS